MASSHSLGRVLLQVISLSLAPLVSACGGINTDGFDAIACNEDQTEPQYVAKLKLAASADYVELRVLPNSPEDLPRTVDAVGDMCAKATDKAQCEAKVAAATSSTGFRFGECGLVCQSAILIVNSGDDVTVVDTKEDVLARVLSVDAPADAVLMTALSDYSVGCGDVNQGGVRKSGSSFEVIASRITLGCEPLVIRQYRLQVSADGSIKELQSHVLESYPHGCI